MQWVIVALLLVVGFTMVFIAIKGNGAALFGLITNAGSSSATAAPADAEGVAAGNALGSSFGAGVAGGVAAAGSQ